jgi:hypothetical protein
MKGVRTEIFGMWVWTIYYYKYVDSVQYLFRQFLQILSFYHSLASIYLSHIDVYVGKSII